jgi:hypothetical protein
MHSDRTLGRFLRVLGRFKGREGFLVPELVAEAIACQAECVLEYPIGLLMAVSLNP